MAALLIIGAVGVGLLVLSLLLGDFLDGVFEGFDIDAGGLLSTEVIGAFLGAFGFGGRALGSGTALSWPVVGGGGLGLGGGGGALCALLLAAAAAIEICDPRPRCGGSTPSASSSLVIWSRSIDAAS